MWEDQEAFYEDFYADDDAICDLCDNWYCKCCGCDCEWIEGEGTE